MTPLCRPRALPGLLLLAQAACASSTSADAGTPVTRHIEEVLTLMQTRSYLRASKDWTTIRADVLALANGAQTIPDLAPAIRRALTLLGDGHSTYTSAGGTVVFVPTRTCAAPTVTAPELPATIGYVRVGAFSGTTAQAEAFMTTVRNAIIASNRADLEGWIVDLRGNSGGNMWPMIAGLGPILGESTLGYFRDGGGVFSDWSYRSDAAYLGSTIIARSTVPVTLIRANPRVAVLHDGRTASSGEAMVIAFRGRPDTRSFGAATCGLSTANELFRLSDGAALNLADAVMVDRTKTVYGDVIQPDEVVGGEAIVTRAVQWIRTGK